VGNNKRDDVDLSGVTNKSFIKNIIIGLSILVLWKIITLGMSEWYEQQIFDNDNAVDNSLAWSAEQPGVLYRASQIDSGKTSQEINQLLSRSIQGNPSDGRVLMSFGNFLLSQKQVSLADKLVVQATKMLPVDAYTHIEASSYWLRRNNPDKAIESWDTALQTTPQLKTKVFPLLLSWLQENKFTTTLNRIVKNPPDWWPDFFDYVAKNASDIKTIDSLYNLRRSSGNKISTQERDAYVNRLKKAGLWAEAFLAWLNGLGVNGLKYMGQPYNGNFEAPITQSGFGWNNHKLNGVLVEIEQTFGNTGQRALHLVFQGENVNYKHFYQTLFLAPARYRVSGSVRPDSLVSTGGLRWKLHCLTGTKDLLGQSERFLGVGQWRKFAFEVNASNCDAQELRLEAVIKNQGDAIINGEIWFDAITIERL